MRELFHARLDSMVDNLVQMTLMVETSMGRATTALLEADADLATRVIDDEDAVPALRDQMDREALELTARQQPVAGDLRTVVAAMRMTADLERMGVLAEHVAQVALNHAPRPAVPEDLRALLEGMGRAAERITAATREAIANRDGQVVSDLEHADDEVDRLLESLYQRMLHEPWPYGPQTAVDLTLLGRYYERYADHAVSVARRVAYLEGRAQLDRGSRSRESA